MLMETKDDDKENIPPAKNFGAFIDSYRDEKSRLYMVDEVLPEMRDEIVLPLCLRCEEIDQFFFVSYFWLSGGNTHSTAHIDTDENLLCVLNGHKRVRKFRLKIAKDFQTMSFDKQTKLQLVSEFTL